MTNNDSKQNHLVIILTGKYNYEELKKAYHYPHTKVVLRLKTAQRTNKWKKIIMWTILSIVIIVVSVYVYLNSVTYSPTERAETAMTSDAQVIVAKIKDGYRFEPVGTEEITKPNIIFIQVVWLNLKVILHLPEKWQNRVTAYISRTCQ